MLQLTYIREMIPRFVGKRCGTKVKLSRSHCNSGTFRSVPMRNRVVGRKFFRDLRKHEILCPASCPVAPILSRRICRSRSRTSSPNQEAMPASPTSGSIGLAISDAEAIGLAFHSERP
jgi:hypothetical protein